jgi:hypothetical protein
MGAAGLPIPPRAGRTRAHREDHQDYEDNRLCTAATRTRRRWRPRCISAAVLPSLRCAAQGQRRRLRAVGGRLWRLRGDRPGQAADTRMHGGTLCQGRRASAAAAGLVRASHAVNATARRRIAHRQSGPKTSSTPAAAAMVIWVNSPCYKSAALPLGLVSGAGALPCQTRLDGGRGRGCHRRGSGHGGGALAVFRPPSAHAYANGKEKPMAACGNLRTVTEAAAAAALCPSAAMPACQLCTENMVNTVGSVLVLSRNSGL